MDQDVHLLVADVVKSFDTVDRGILNRVLSSLGLPAWFRHVYFEHHAHVRLRFKLAAGLGEPWTRDGGIPQGCPLSMMFIVALYLPWCRYLGELPDVTPQLYADNLKCVSSNPEQLLRAARITSGYVRLVGQEPAPSKCVLLSTSAAVRRDMKAWVISGEGERWSVKLDIRDLGGHLDSTYRAWGRTLAARVLAVPRVVWMVSALPLDYRGKLRILRTMYIPAALHGIEASLLSQSNVLKLRAAFVRACWSSKLTLAHSGTVLGMLDGPECVDPVEMDRVSRLLDFISDGAPGHGPLHLLVDSAAGLGFRWCPEGYCWSRPGLPRLPMIGGPYQHFHTAILDACRDQNSACLCRRKGFRGGPLLDFRGSMQLLFSSHVRERDKALLRGILSGGVWNGFLLGKVQGENVSCRFCGGPDGDGHLFLDCPFPPLVAIRESPEFCGIVSLDKGSWPRCLLWHGWLPALSGSEFGNPRAEGAYDVASKCLEVALGSYVDEGPWDDGVFVIGDDQRELSDAPDVWSDGSLVVHEVSGVGVAGCGVYAHASGSVWSGRKWGHLDLLPALPNGGGEDCRLYCPVPGPLQSVQRAEIWGALIALQGCLRMHIGINNLHVVNHLTGFIAGRRAGRPFPLVNDGDLLFGRKRIIPSLMPGGHLTRLVYAGILWCVNCIASLLLMHGRL